jgi:hypothetical protein
LDKKKRSKNKHKRASGAGRPLVYGVRLLLLLTDETVAGIDAARGDDESRVQLIRSAIERELERRERSSR